MERLKKELEEANAAHAQCAQKAMEATQMIVESQVLVNNLKKAGTKFKNTRDGLAIDVEAARKTIAGLTMERDDLQKVVDDLQKVVDEGRGPKRKCWKLLLRSTPGDFGRH